MFHIEHGNIFEGFNQQNQMVDCMLNNPPSSSNFRCSDLADMMQFAEQEAATDEEKTSVHVNSAVEILEVKGKSKRKRAKASKTGEEVERQRMTHIAVERNRRKQMNDHLQILRSLMPSYYSPRGDQASIVGGAIQFVRELEQLLQCLESVKMHQALSILPAALDQTAESNSCLGDVQVTLSGLFGLIKIVSRRRRRQLIKIIAAVEHLQLHILHTDITTVQEDVVCCFSVKMSGEAVLTAEDIANSIQQILNSLHAN